MNDQAILNFWRAFLIRVIRDLDYSFYRYGAEAYVMDNDERVLGFRWVCTILDMDPDIMRLKIMTPSIRNRINHGNRVLQDAA